MSNEEDDKRPSPMQRLLYRWFVEYNPFYLLSALLVLVGMTALSSAAASSGQGEGEIGLVPIIAELYVFALLGGAALLARIGQRRPAVMLGLLTVLYQADLTLFTERQAHLGSRGSVAAIVWLALFAAKLYGLARVFELRLSRTFVATAALGAVSLIAIPRVRLHLHASEARPVFSLWIVGLVAAFLWTRRVVTSTRELSDWEATVLRRSRLACTGIWAFALAMHLKLSDDPALSAAMLLPVALLLAMRWLETEPGVWGLSAVSLLIAQLVSWSMKLEFPEGSWMLSLVVTAALARRAWTATEVVERTSNVSRRAGYRAGGDAEEADGVLATEVLSIVDPAARARYFGGAILAGWITARQATLAPSPLVDAALLAATAIFALRLRRWEVAGAPSLALGYLALSSLHAARLTTGEWGVTGVVVGFAMLGGSLGVGYRLRQTHVTDGPTSARPEPFA